MNLCLDIFKVSRKEMSGKKDAFVIYTDNVAQDQLACSWSCECNTVVTEFELMNSIHLFCTHMTTSGGLTYTSVHPKMPFTANMFCMRLYTPS